MIFRIIENTIAEIKKKYIHTIWKSFRFIEGISFSIIDRNNSIWSWLIEFRIRKAFESIFYFNNIVNDIQIKLFQFNITFFKTIKNQIQILFKSISCISGIQNESMDCYQFCWELFQYLL